MAFEEQNHAIEAFCTDRAYEPLRVRIAVGRQERSPESRRLVLPKRIDSWSLTSLQQRVVGGRLVRRAPYYWLLLVPASWPPTAHRRAQGEERVHHKTGVRQTSRKSHGAFGCGLRASWHMTRQNVKIPFKAAWRV